MAHSQALLYVQMDPPPGAEEAFHTWYDDHMAARIAVPGFLNASRYRNVDPEGPRHLAVYDLADASVLASAAYEALRAREADNPRDREMRASFPFVERRLYRCIDAGEPWAAPRTDQYEHAPLLMSVALEPPPNGVQEFHDWYREEHSPMLMKASGWRRIRRYEQLEGSGPRFMALHELASLGGYETAEYRAATSTPWRERVIGAVVRRERLRFELINGLTAT